MKYENNSKLFSRFGRFNNLLLAFNCEMEFISDFIWKLLQPN